VKAGAQVQIKNKQRKEASKISGGVPLYRKPKTLSYTFASPLKMQKNLLSIAVLPDKQSKTAH
jgi:hypothetical protein